MDVADIEATEYEIHFYRISLDKLTKTIKEEIEAAISVTVSSVIEKLKSKHAVVDDEKSKQIQNEQINFEKHLREKFHPIMDNLKEEIVKNLQIPENVLFPSDEIYMEKVTEAEIDNLKHDILILKSKIKLIKYQIRKCQQAKSKLKKLGTFLDNFQLNSELNCEDIIDSECFLNLLNNLKLMESKCFGEKISQNK